MVGAGVCGFFAAGAHFVSGAVLVRTKERTAARYAFSSSFFSRIPTRRWTARVVNLPDAGCESIDRREQQHSAAPRAAWSSAITSVPASDRVAASGIGLSPPLAGRPDRPWLMLQCTIIRYRPLAPGVAKAQRNIFRCDAVSSTLAQTVPQGNRKRRAASCSLPPCGGGEENRRMR